MSQNMHRRLIFWNLLRTWEGSYVTYFEHANPQLGDLSA